jgi:hypothetical protein
VTAPAACAPRSPAVMHASDDRSRTQFPRLPQTHARPPGNHDVEPPNPTCARVIWKTACDYRWEGVPCRCAQEWYVGSSEVRAGVDGARVYEFCKNRAERVCWVPFLCARGRWRVVRSASCVVRREDREARCNGLRRRPGFKATGRRLVGAFLPCGWHAEETASAKRLRFGLRQQGSGFAALLSRGAPLACQEIRFGWARKAKAHRPRRAAVRWHEGRERPLRRDASASACPPRQQGSGFATATGGGVWR